MEKEGSALYLCPGCGAFVSESASACPKCGAVLDASPEEPEPLDELKIMEPEHVPEPEPEIHDEPADEDSQPVTLFLCASCGAFTGGSATVCPKCGASMVEDEEEPEPLIKPHDPEADLLDMLVSKDEDAAEELIEDLKNIESAEDVVNFIESIPFKDPDMDLELELEEPEEPAPKPKDGSDDLLSQLVYASEKPETEEKPTKAKAVKAVNDIIEEKLSSISGDSDTIALCSNCGAFVSETAQVCNVCGNTLKDDKKFVAKPRPVAPDLEGEKADSIMRSLLGVADDAELDKDAGTRFQSDGSLGLCTVCGAFISENAASCPVCGTHMEDMPEFIPSMDVEGPEKEDHGLALCPHCGVFVQEGAKECLSCVKPIPEGATIKPAYDEELPDESDKASNVLRTFLGVEKALEMAPTRDPTFSGLEICPDCGAFVSINAIACSVCGNLLFEGADEIADLDKQIGDLDHMECPNCGTSVESESAECPLCGFAFVTAEEPAVDEGPALDITDFLETELEGTIKALEEQYAAPEPEPPSPAPVPLAEEPHDELADMLVTDDENLWEEPPTESRDEEDLPVPEFDLLPSEVVEEQVIDEVPDMVQPREPEPLEFIEPEYVEEEPAEEEYEEEYEEELVEEDIAPESQADLSRFDAAVQPPVKAANWATGVYGSVIAISIFIALYAIWPGDYVASLAVIFGTFILLGFYLLATEKGTFFRGDIKHASVFIAGFVAASITALHWPLGIMNSEAGLMGQPAIDRLLLSVSILLSCIGLLWIRARVRFVFAWFSGIGLIFISTLTALAYANFSEDSVSPVLMVSGLGAGLIVLSLIFLQYERAINTSIESDIVRGDAHYLKRDYTKALASYDNALMKSQINRVDVLGSPLVEYDVPWYSKGSALILMGQFEEGIKCLDMALAINPNNEATWVNKGNAHSKLGEHETAMECYRRAMESNPFYEVAWNNMGNAYARQKNYVEALRHYNRAIKINPRYDDAWINKGYVLAKMGKREQAIKCLNHVGSRAKGEIPPIEHDVQTL